MTRILDRYVVGAVIKAGETSTVHEAQDTRLQAPCAAKSIPFDPTDAQARERFEEEARRLARLEHPGLPRVLDYAIEGSTAWLVMERIRGDDLYARLAFMRRLPQREVVDIALQILDLLSYLHDQGIVYKGLNPANIMRRPDGHIFLVDFGVALALSPSSSLNTGLDAHAYAPPEQVQGNAEPRSDLYALAATMHHMLSGKAPSAPFCFEPIRSLCPELDRGLESIVHQALSEDPAQRFSSAALMKTALERHGGTASPAAGLSSQTSSLLSSQGMAPGMVAGMARPTPSAAASPPPVRGAVSSSFSASSIGASALGSPAASPTVGAPPLSLPQTNREASWSSGLASSAPTESRRGASAPRGIEYVCGACGMRVYSYVGLKLKCRRCGGVLSE